MTRLIYLDYAAATPLDKQVLSVMQPYFSDKFYNPSATYTPATEVSQDIKSARAKVALCLGVRSSEIVFTAGGSEANNLAIHGIMRAYPGANMLLSSIEHESVIKPAQDYKNKLVVVKPDGRIDLDDLKRQIDDRSVLISVMYANNEVGTVQPLSEIASIIKGIKADRLASGNKLPLIFHSDGAQAPNYLDLHVVRLGVDLLTLNGGKIYGPKQSGALYVKAGLSLLPLITGGGQERGLRSGTENVAAIIGFAKALAHSQKLRHEESNRLRIIQTKAFSLIADLLPGSIINGSLKYRLPNNIHLSLPGHDNERLLLQLEAKGILAAAGSACSAADEQPSHVLKAMGLSDDMARSSLRFTMGRGTTEANLKFTLRELAKLIA